MLRNHYPKRFEDLIATMVNIAEVVGIGGNISFSNSSPVALDVLTLAFVLLGRYLAALSG